MKSVRENCLEFIGREDIRNELKEIITPIFRFIYNEIYIYVWFICIYHVFLIFIILANLFLLLRFLRKPSLE